MDNSRVKLAEHVRTFADRDGAILMDIRAGQYYSVNAVGSLICSALVNGSSDRELAAMIATEYSLAASAAESDTNAFLGMLRSHQLVEALPAGGAR